MHNQNNKECPWNDPETFCNPAIAGLPCNCPTIKLLKFEADLGEGVFVLTSKKPNYIRNTFNIWDHGGQNYDVFARQFKEGEVVEINNLKQLNDSEFDIIPYVSDELEDPDIDLYDWLHYKPKIEFYNYKRSF